MSHAYLVRFLVGLISVVTALQAATVPKPNIVLILADDLGAHDLGVTGSSFHKTPHLDRLARTGIRFTQAYSACTVCSPTRAALLTGKYPARLKITDWIAGHEAPTAKLRPPVDWVKQLPLSETTLAERARAAGYSTVHIGKWHLGGEGFGPLEQGFDVNLGGDHRGQPPSYFAPYGLPTLKDGAKGEYLTDRQGADAAAYITSHRSTPFFISLALYGVHTPLQAKPELEQKYRSKTAQATNAQANATYAAMLESVDAAVGRILKAIDESGLTEKTLIIFTSDNGGLVLGAKPPTSNSPLRSGKGSPYEGGVRIPLIVRWPGITQAGSTSSQSVISMDITATVATALGEKAASVAPDGLDLTPVFKDPSAALGRESLFWHYPHYHPGGATPYSAIRSDNWKLIQYFEDGRNELFNLTEDPGETTDLSVAQPDQVLQLARRLADWQGRVGSQWPMGNSNYIAIPQTATTDGSILLHSRSAVVHGTTLRYEPMPFKNTLGYWGRVEDWASWTFTLKAAGSFEIELTQGCGRGSGGSEVDLIIDGQTVPFKVEETGHFQNFIVRHPGRITLAEGAHVFAVKPRRKPGGAVMDLRQIRLVPANPWSAPTESARAVLAAHRIAVVGDSITYGGDWVEFVETWVRLHFPKAHPEFINLGLPSETASGLSEEGHAGGTFPRPDINERLGRILAKVKPDLILACYGMNDGIYFPLNEERFNKFKDGLRRLHETAAHEGVRVLHLTPPTFDPIPLAGRTLPAGLTAYPQPFEGYDGVLGAYSDWLIAQRTQGWAVSDVHGPMRQFLDVTRQKDSNFRLAGDGVHANRQGHWLIARAFLAELGAPTEVVAAPLPEPVFAGERATKILSLVRQRQRIQKDAWLTYSGHKRPGMAAGKPLADAEAQAKAIQADLLP